MNPQIPENPDRWGGLHEILRMAGPIILGSLSFAFMQFVDQLMVAQLGPEALAAIGSAGVWSYTMATFFIGVVSCVTTFVSQSVGRGRLADCARYTWQGIYISLAAGAVAFVFWPLSDAMFGAMGHSAEVTRLEVIYFKIRLFSYGLIACQVATASFFQSISRPLVPMYCTFAANFVNIVLDYVLIFGKWGFPAWGIAGAAVATCIALLFQCGLQQVLFMTGDINRDYNVRRSYRLDWHKAYELVRIGWPSGIQHLLDVMNWSIFISFLVGKYGTTALAANNVALALMTFSFVPALGLHHGIAPIVGQWIGRGDIARAKARTYLAISLAAAYMLLMGCTFAFFGPSIIRDIFGQTDEVVAIGQKILIFAAVFQGFDAINIVVSGALRGAGDTRWMAIVTAIGAYVVFLPMGYTFAEVLGGGAMGAWFGATLYIIGMSGLLFHRFSSERWRYIAVFLPEPAEAPPAA